MGDTVLTWRTGNHAGTVRLGPSSSWQFGSRPKVREHDLCFQHPSISALALVVRTDELGTQLERLQGAYGATVWIDNGRTDPRPLTKQSMYRFERGETAIRFAVDDFELLLVVDVPRSPEPGGRTRAPTPKELEHNDDLLMSTLAAALSARGKVTGPSLCLAWANWKGKTATPPTETQGSLLREALASRGRPKIARGTNKVDLLVATVSGDFDDAYLDDIYAELEQRRRALRTEDVAEIGEGDE